MTFSDFVWRQRNRSYFARHQKRYEAWEFLSSLIGLERIDSEGEPLPEHFLSVNLPVPTEGEEP